MKYDLIYNQLKEQIHSTDSHYQVGDRLPTEQQLSLYFEVSRSTIRKVLNRLNQEGMIECVQGKGHFIRQKRNELVYPLPKVDNIVNNQESIDIIKYQIMTVPTSIAQSLDLSINDKVYSIKRLIYKDGNPLKIQEIFLPCKQFPMLTYSDMLQPLLNVIKKYQPQNEIISRLHFIPASADSTQAELLNIIKGKLLQQMILQVTSITNLSLGYMITTYSVEKNSVFFVCPYGVD